MKMYKSALIFVCIFALGFTYYLLPGKKLDTIIPDYSIVDIDVNNSIKCVASIRIREKISDEFLIAIAKKAKEEISPIASQVHMFFLLPEMQIDNGAWARVDFDPDIKVVHLGQTLTTSNIITNNAGHIQDYVGLWIDNLLDGDIVVRIRKDKNIGFVFEYISSSNPKPSELASPLKRYFKNGKIICKDIESNTGEYFVVENNGDLSCYDNSGYISTLKKLK